jgi:acyl transferase domain-containing protein/acyl carrier protein
VTLSAAKLALAVKRLRMQMGSPDLLNSDPIAVIGMGCRLPGDVDSLDSYWSLLRDGVDAITELPPGRSQSCAGMTELRGGFLKNVDHFDAEFFGISRREAERLDPQHRLLMEVLWESLWDARIEPEKTAGNTCGVFAGVYNNDYFRLQFGHAAEINAYTSTGTSHSAAVGRISFLLDWKGPSIAIDTACSSSLVAVHMACQSLRSNECNMAVAGGVSLILAPEEVISLEKLGMLAPDGRCKTFDSRADGFVPGEGCAIVVLKRLTEALMAGDPIRAVIRGTAVNQDGRSTVLTAPNGLSQRAVIRAALKNAQVEGTEIEYVEAHGTGTALGDPIEVEALAEVFGEGPTPCVLGSVKTNFGHLEAASGVAGLTKAILALEHGLIPRTLHFRQLNPHIILEGTRVAIADRAMPWPRGATPRFASVSSFGFGGTNAHVVLEEAPLYSGPSRPPVEPHSWRRQRYWFTPAAPRDGANTAHPLLGRRITSPVLRETIFENELSIEAPEFLADHRPHGNAIVPLTAYLEAFLAASGGSALEDVIVQETLPLPACGTQKIQVVVNGEDLRLFSEDHGTWKLHATARAASDASAALRTAITDLRRTSDEEKDVEQFYEGMAARGLSFGPTFRLIDKLWTAPERALALVRAPNAAYGYRVHPAILDACFQPMGALLPDDGIYLPLGLRRFQLFRTPKSDFLWAQATVRSGSNAAVTGDVRIFNPEGELIATAQGLWLRKPAAENRQHLSEVVWVPRHRQTVQEFSARGRWLVFSDESGIGSAIVAGIEAQGGHCVVVKRGEEFENLLGDGPLGGVVHLWSLDAAAANDSSDESLLRDERAICGSVLRLTQILAQQSGAEKSVPERPCIWIVTQGAQFAHAGQRECCVAQAPVWGLARTIRRENPDRRCISVDLDPEKPSAARLLEEILHPDGESQVAWRAESRLVPQLAERNEDQKNVTLQATGKGRLEELRWENAARREPGPGEVEIRVAATGLNFRDVLNALGEYPGDAGPLGSECSGWIERVGEGVTGLGAGDEVVAVARGSFGDFVTTPADLVAPKPVQLRMDEAAALPIAYVTARYALEALGNLRAGQRILIHAAAGGVGLAAVAEAQRIGAKIYATVGSDEKREWLKSLGVQHIMNSRGFDYHREIMEQTAGAGVDVVLNSLTGQHIRDSVNALAAGGVFLELGKRGIWDALRVHALRPDVHYFVVDWGEEYAHNAAPVAAVFRGVIGDLDSGALKPLPCRKFARFEIEGAFRWMAQGRHIGKIVVRMSTGFGVRHDGAYLITGGMGALGLKIAKWMVARGAGRLVLVGRNEPGREARSVIRAMEATGSQVDVRRADVAHKEELERILREINEGNKPLRGVVYAAGVLDDAVLSEQNWDRFARVMGPKVHGAWHLHCLTEKLELDFFVMFSSLAALLGSPGQGNYAAANAFLDALAHHRRTQGLPALSVNWGPWEDSGMAARPEAKGWRRSFPELTALSADEGLGLWERALANADAAQLAAFSSRATGPTMGGPVTDQDETARKSPDLAGARGEKLVESLREEVAKIIGLHDASELDVDAPLFEAGLDSLMAIEFRNVLGAAFGRSFSSTLLFDYPSVKKLSVFLEGNCGLESNQDRAGAGLDLQNLDESAAEALLMAELGMGTDGKG